MTIVRAYSERIETPVSRLTKLSNEEKEPFRALLLGEQVLPVVRQLVLCILARKLTINALLKATTLLPNIKFGPCQTSTIPRALKICSMKTEPQ